MHDHVSRRCSSNDQCGTGHDNGFPDTYCSKITNGEDKFCCPVPYSKMFRDENRYLPPTRAVGHHRITNSPKDIARELTAMEGEFSKKCTKNSDCGEDEFCDDVVTRRTNSSISVDKMKQWKPKICFPGREHLFMLKFPTTILSYAQFLAPKCAGRAAKVLSGTGIKFCKDQSACGENEFCDTNTHHNLGDTFRVVNQLGLCCQYNCTEEALATGKADASIVAFASFTASKAQCNDDGNCGNNGLCITAKDQSKLDIPLPKGKELKLCCRFGAREEEELYRCLIDKPLRDTSNQVIKCSTDEDCNREEGRALRDPKFWKYECVQSKSKEKHCCRAPHCNDDITFMRTEMDCKTSSDCMKDEDDKSDPESRAVCTDFNERNEKAKKKKCCPICVDPTDDIFFGTHLMVFYVSCSLRGAVVPFNDSEPVRLRISQ
ncbi:hypothetical protein Y032_0005g2719 [Ancylostoma ceylanicum]|uniref:Uncharacterized protein n=1 Tax=Ancylostoma ceylanicum TaxID=53326 RepID=A0A016VSN4_9BILA|nr:hypothetical protein Y032_0005g2719 [Ancylostoma ceylanicum]